MSQLKCFLIRNDHAAKITIKKMIIIKLIILDLDRNLHQLS